MIMSLTTYVGDTLPTFLAAPDHQKIDWSGPDGQVIIASWALCVVTFLSIVVATLTTVIEMTHVQKQLRGILRLLRWLGQPKTRRRLARQMKSERAKVRLTEVARAVARTTTGESVIKLDDLFGNAASGTATTSPADSDLVDELLIASKSGHVVNKIRSRRSI